jgi:acetyltransferase-like isoleucine patch superfamily enzyme
MLRRVARRVLRRGANDGDANPGIERGALTYGSPHVRFYEGDEAKVTIGAYTSIADEVVIIPGGNHRADWVSTFPFRVVLELPGAFENGHPASRGDVAIGNDVWIGRGATILSGVEIGDGAIVGAAAVVSASVRPYAVVVGNPAREVKRRFSDDEVEALLRIAWWNWPGDLVRERVPLLNGSSVAEFIERFDPERGAAS